MSAAATGPQAQSTPRSAAVIRVRDVQAVVIEGGKRADHTTHDCHRVGITAEAAIERGELLVQHGVAGDRAAEVGQFGLARQFAV